jgi:hypothetical protein
MTVSQRPSLARVALPRPYMPMTEDPELLDRYVNGQCWLIALVLAEECGLQPIVLSDSSESKTAHCFCIDAEGMAVDVEGRIPLDETLDSWNEYWPYSATELVMVEETVEGLKRRMRDNLLCDYPSGLPEARDVVHAWLAARLDGPDLLDLDGPDLYADHAAPYPATLAG